MHVRSLALSTELGLAATRGRVIDRGDYLVVVTPDDPSFYDGNYIVLPAPPQVGEVAFSIRRFTEELGHDPQIRHVTLRWDGTTQDVGARDELTAAGFTIDQHLVMTASEVTAPPLDLEIRALVASELLATADLAFAIGDIHNEHYRQFLVRRAHWHRSLVERGLGRFFGTFDRDELVGSLGIVPLGRVARYQDVQTAIADRKRGIASALLAAAATYARGVGCESVVIVAEAGSAAARVYERTGFQLAEYVGSAWRLPG